MTTKKERYVMLRYWLLKSQAWNSLSGNARALYVEIARRYNGSNNGRISYSTREAGQSLHISPCTAGRLLRILQDRGFIVCTKRGAFDFETVARHITDKLIRRHPHVFGNLKVKDVDQVWANWEKIKHAEKHGTRHARPSALDGIPKHLPALLRAEKLAKKAKRAKE